MRLLQSIRGKGDKHIRECSRADAYWALEVNCDEREKKEIFLMLVILIIRLGDLRVIKQSLEGPTRNYPPLLRRLREENSVKKVKIL